MAELEQGLEELKVVKQAFKDNISANDISTSNVQFRNMPALLKQMEKKLPLQTKNVNPTTSAQTITADSGYKLGEVNVWAVNPSDYYKPEESISITPKTASQTITPSGNVVYNKINVGAVTSDIDSNLIPTNIRKGTTILGVQGNLEADKPDQEKTVTPTTTKQIVVADTGYELSKVTINEVTNSIDSNIVAGNIKEGVSILGVLGTFEGAKEIVLQQKTINPTTSEQLIVADEGFDGLSGVNVSAVTSEIDENIKAENIKAGVTILGVEGAMQATSGSPKFGELVDGSMTSIETGDLAGVSEIRDSAFIGITALESASIPSNVQTIGDSAFEGCTSLSTLSIAEGIQTIGASAFSGINASEINIPSSVTSVGESAFANNTAISSVTIPSGITELPSKLFDGCTNLSKVTMDSSIPPTIESDTFPSNVVEIYVKYGAYDDYYSAWLINVFDTTMEKGNISNSNGINETNDNRVRTAGYISVQPNTTYVFTRSLATGSIGLRFYNSSKAFTTTSIPMTDGQGSAEFTTDSNTHYIRFIQETTDTTVKYEIYAKEGGVNQKLVRLPAKPSTLTITVNNYLGELVSGAKVTISGNGQTYTGTTNENGVFTQSDLQPATYSIEVADLEGFKTPSVSDVVVEEDTHNSVTITYLEKKSYILFSEATPAQISAVSAEISANNMTSEQVAETYGWNIGDTISYQLSTGENVEMRIIGFNHDDLSDGSGKAGITLEMTHCLKTSYYMHGDGTNLGGYPASHIKTRSGKNLQSIKSTIPQEWRDVIKLVNKKSANGGASNYSQTLTTSEDLFLLAEIEVFGTVINAQDGINEGVVYEYWSGKTATNRIKMKDADSDGVPEVATAWWMRSCATIISCYCSVKTDGTSYGYNNAWSTLGISYAFCV